MAPASYLHGQETIETTVGGRSISVRKTAVWGIVGTAPIHLVPAANQSVNVLQLCTSQQDDAKFFGPETAGFSLPAALRALRKRNTGTVLAVNVFDPTIHKTAVAAEADTFVNDVFTLDFVPLSGSLVVKSVDGLTAYVENTDYTVDYTTGNVTRKGTGTITSGETVHTNYNKPDPSLITASNIIGAVSGTGVKTGMQLWMNAMALYGFNPKLLLAPGYSNLTGIQGELSSKADLFKAFYFVDAPLGTTVDGAIAGRGPAGTIPAFNISDGRGMLLFPYLSRQGVLEPYSQHFAALTAWVDENEGYWVSPSNHPIVDIDGLELPIIADFRDANSETNQLNSVAITTVYNAFGTGLRAWGNRSSAFPTLNDTTTMMSVRRTADIIEEAIAFAQFPFIDKPLGQAQIDVIVNTVNKFLNSLKGTAIIDGKMWFDPANNNTDDLSNGHAVWSYDFMPPPNLARITDNVAINTNYLTQLFGGSN